MQEKHSKAGGSDWAMRLLWATNSTVEEGEPVEKEWSMKMKDVNNSEIHLKGEQKRGKGGEPGKSNS